MKLNNCNKNELKILRCAPQIMIEFRTKFCKNGSSRKKTYIEKQIGLFCANKPSELYPNTLPPTYFL
jgi:hypothetical protein